jgi:hypothetical protein
MMILLLLLQRLLLVSSFRSISYLSPTRQQHPYHKTTRITLHVLPTQIANDGPDQTRICHQRRSLLAAPLKFLLFSQLTFPAYAIEDAKTNSDDVVVYQLASGVEFRNLRQGSGPAPITISKDDDDKVENIVVLHLKAMTRDRVELFDTFDKSPILYELGTSQNFDVFGGDASKRPKVTQGVEDAILSRGKAYSVKKNGVVINQNERVEPMREGGKRRVIVPAALAYGHAGVSRYDAWRMGLKNPVPRDQDIFYDIEILRCSTVDVEAANNGDASASNIPVKACCLEDNYPCQVPKPRIENAESQ